MLGIAKRRLLRAREHPPARGLGYDSPTHSDNSVDAVYTTVVFMHLE